jgi:hypothetical protein
MPPPLDYTIRYQIRSGRVNFANYVQRRQLVQDGRLLGLKAYVPDGDASIVSNLEEGAASTTPAEYNAYIAAVAPPVPEPEPPAPSGPLIQSKNNTTDGGFPVGGTVTKDMDNENYAEEFDPNSYQSEFFPGMTDFIDENIVQGDKASEDRLVASYWSDLGNDVFDDWGYFYIYDIDTGKYYFPLINPQNGANGTLTTQTFVAFGRTFTITQGWCVQGIFKFDVSVNDTRPFRFGAYGNMGSDGDEVIDNLTYGYTLGSTSLTLYYQKHAESGDSNEILYSYWIPKTITENATQSYDFYNDEDNNSMMSKEVINGILVYFAKKNDVKEWVTNDLEIAS